jgi:hypothetical protein
MAIGGEMNALFEQMMRTAQSASNAFAATSQRKSDASAQSAGEAKGFLGLSNPFSAAMQPLLFPTADPAELDKKIADLSVVKAWLETTTQTVELSIKALEYQRSLLLGFSSKVELPDGETAADDPSKLNPALWAWDMMQKAGAQLQSASESVVRTASETMASAKMATQNATARVAAKPAAKKTKRKSTKTTKKAAAKKSVNSA